MDELKQEIIKYYSSVVANRPFIVLAFITAVTVLMATGAANVETVEQNNEDLLPDSIDSVAAFDIIGAEFGQGGGGSTYTILFETSPSYPNSTEIRDVRNPKMLTYMETVANDISSFDEVISVSSPSDLVDNPPTKRVAWNQMQESGNPYQFISSDYSFAIMRVSSTDISSAEEEELANRIKTSVDVNDKPSGIEVGYTGDVFINQAFQQESQSTQGQTTIISLVGVLLVVILLFRSVINGLISLSALIFGILSGFGLYGLIGLNLSPATSGAISMGMGIAIDFGIQTVSRYKEERQEYGIEKSIQKIIEGVFKPMTIALIAAIIGFTALSFGRITFLSDLGTMLTFTTLFAYIGALTLIPVLLVLYDKYGKKYIPTDIYEKILR